MPRPDAVPEGEGWADPGGWPARARRLGPLRYSELGRRSLPTPPDQCVEPLAAWLATSLDRWWDEAGGPDPFTVIVLSGDRGALAAAVLGQPTRSRAALRYVLVHPDANGPEWLAETARFVQLEDPAFLYPSAGGAAVPDGFEDFDFEAEERPSARGIGPLATFLTDVPALGDNDGAIVAVDWLGRLPYDLYESRDGGWVEVRLAASGDRLAEMVVPVGDDRCPPIPPRAGRRWRHQVGAGDWVRRVIPTAAGGTLAVVDRWGEPDRAGPDQLDLDQLRQARQPLDPEPAPVPGTAWSVVRWRLG